MTHLYIVAQGSVALQLGGRRLVICTEGQAFGVEAQLTGCPSSRVCDAYVLSRDACCGTERSLGAGDAGAAAEGEGGDDRSSESAGSEGESDEDADDDERGAQARAVVIAIPQPHVQVRRALRSGRVIPQPTGCMLSAADAA